MAAAAEVLVMAGVVETVVAVVTEEAGMAVVEMVGAETAVLVEAGMAGAAVVMGGMVVVEPVGMVGAGMVVVEPAVAEMAVVAAPAGMAAVGTMVAAAQGRLRLLRAG